MKRESEEEGKRKREGRKEAKIRHASSSHVVTSTPTLLCFLLSFLFSFPTSSIPTGTFHPRSICHELEMRP